MKKLIFLITIISFFMLGINSGADYRALHFNSIVVDTHNDVIQRILNGEDISIRSKNGHSDLPRFIEGGLDIEVFSIWAPPEKKSPSYYVQANDQIDSIMSFVKRNPKQVGFARTAAEARDLVKQGKFVAMLGLEGAHPIGNDLQRLDHFYRRGVRYITLTWNNSTSWATSAKDETDTSLHLKQKGLTAFGKKVIKRMNALGMLVDVSHAGEQTFWDVIQTTTKPIIASHSCAWALRHHRRNLKDEQMKAIAKTGGLVCINFAPIFLDSTFTVKETALLKKYKNYIDSLRKSSKDDNFITNMRISDMMRDEYLKIRPPLSKLVDHFDYAAKLIGVDHVGMGSDFDGINSVPLEMDDVTMLPNLTRELLNRGYSESDVKKILGENFLRVLKQAEVQ